MCIIKNTKLLTLHLMQKIILGLLLLCGFNTLFAQLQVREVSPVSANNLVNSFVDVNVAMYNKGVTEREKLVIMLAGKGDVPSDFKRFDSLAANTGFHVLGMSYNNSPTVEDACKGSNDSNCYENVRRQVLLGDVLTPDIQVDSNHYLAKRVKDLLVYLNANASEENWGKYLDSENEVKWEKVILAGHGDGATNASFMGKVVKLSRVINFAPLPEVMEFNKKLASWVSQEGLTPSHRYYVFYQENDTNTLNANFYNGIGFTLFGDKTLVEDAPYPYRLSRDLSTKFISDFNHTITVKDDVTPIEPNGVPKFERVWVYMLTNESFQSIEDRNLEFHIYPNPFKDNLVIELMDHEAPIEWNLYNSLGENVLSGTNHSISTKSLENGIYFMSVSTYNGRFVTRIVKN